MLFCQTCARLVRYAPDTKRYFHVDRVPESHRITVVRSKPAKRQLQPRPRRRLVWG